MDKAEKEEEQEVAHRTKGHDGIVPTRYVVAFLGFVGFLFNYMLRVNINFTIVSMVNFESNETSDDALDECGFFEEDQSSSNSTKNDFNWTPVAQSQVIGAFFYGYIVSQVPGGRLAEMFGAKLIFAVSLGAIAVLNLLMPLASKALPSDDFPWVVVLVRTLMGIFGGPCFPCMSAMLAQWAPVYERARMSALIYAGSQAGTIIAFPLSGFIVNNLGWEYVFYIQGGACFAWLAAWWVLVSDSPATHPRISKEERKYIEQGLELSKKMYPVPWLSIFKSMPFWDDDYKAF